jgi:hypothetical protein
VYATAASSSDDPPGVAPQLAQSGDLDTLKIAISHELWAIGYSATVNADPADSSVVVEVSQLH